MYFIRMILLRLSSTLGTADLPLERASPVDNFIQTRLGIRT